MWLHDRGSAAVSSVVPNLLPPIQLQSLEMKAIVYSGPSKVQYVTDAPLPKLQKPTDAIVKVRNSRENMKRLSDANFDHQVTKSALCGSDLHSTCRSSSSRFKRLASSSTRTSLTCSLNHSLLRFELLHPSTSVPRATSREGGHDYGA